MEDAEADEHAGDAAECEADADADAADDLDEPDT